MPGIARAFSRLQSVRLETNDLPFSVRLIRLDASHRKYLD